ncbi:MAG: aminotransferase class IV [Pleurocapsa sp. SU_196_0]|nr:aminotransferase class IV [Pleurocapsa sp. SU_196_0]
MEDHLERFVNSCAALELTPPCDPTELERRILALLYANEARLSGVSLYLTGGYSEDGFTPGTPNLIMLETPREPYPRAIYQNGAKVITHLHMRELAHAKTTDYLTAVRLNARMKAAGATEVIFKTATQVLEGARAGLGVVLPSGVIVCPMEDVLESVTMHRALRLARAFTRVQRRAISAEEFQTAPELFLTSATRGVMPVTTVDDRAVGNGRVGATVTRLMHALETHTAQYVTERQSTRTSS